jgi:hypothetical protein
MEDKMKRFISLLIISFLLFAASLNAADRVDVLGYTPFADETITVSSIAVSRLNATYRETAGAVFITVETNSIRYRIISQNPTTTVGHIVVPLANQNLWFNDPTSIREFRAISTAGNATLFVTYYRRN